MCIRRYFGALDAFFDSFLKVKVQIASISRSNYSLLATPNAFFVHSHIREISESFLHPAHTRTKTSPIRALVKPNAVYVVVRRVTKSSLPMLKNFNANLFISYLNPLDNSSHWNSTLRLNSSDLQWGGFKQTDA